jgi:hypothetical protein
MEKEDIETIVSILLTDLDIVPEKKYYDVAIDYYQKNNELPDLNYIVEVASQNQDSYNEIIYANQYNGLENVKKTEHFEKNDEENIRYTNEILNDNRTDTKYDKYGKNIEYNNITNQEYLEEHIEEDNDITNQEYLDKHIEEDNSITNQEYLEEHIEDNGITNHEYLEEHMEEDNDITNQEYFDEHIENNDITNQEYLDEHIQMQIFSSSQNIFSVKKVIKNIDKVSLVIFGEIKNNYNNVKCFICYDKFKNSDICRLLPCNHLSHQHCIDYYLTKVSYLCPYCSSPVGEYIYLNI